MKRRKSKKPKPLPKMPVNIERLEHLLSKATRRPWHLVGIGGSDVLFVIKGPFKADGDVVRMVERADAEAIIAFFNFAEPMLAELKAGRAFHDYSCKPPSQKSELDEYLRLQAVYNAAREGVKQP